VKNTACGLQSLVRLCLVREDARADHTLDHFRPTRRKLIKHSQAMLRNNGFDTISSFKKGFQQKIGDFVGTTFFLKVLAVIIWG